MPSPLTTPEALEAVMRAPHCFSNAVIADTIAALIRERDEARAAAGPAVPLGQRLADLCAETNRLMAKAAKVLRENDLSDEPLAPVMLPESMFAQAATAAVKLPSGRAIQVPATAYACGEDGVAIGWVVITGPGPFPLIPIRINGTATSVVVGGAVIWLKRPKTVLAGDSLNLFSVNLEAVEGGNG